MKNKPAFKAKYKCIVGSQPKLKADNIVIRPENGTMIVERVVGKAKRRVKQPWPNDLILVVRGNVAIDLADRAEIVQPEAQ